MKRRFYIAVCDDEKEDREEIVEMAESVCSEENILGDITGFSSAEELLKVMQEGREFDLVILDVMMPELGGMELAKHLRSEKKEMSIVFISNNREMAMQGYKVSASRYLGKPLEKEELREAIIFCAAQRKNKEIFLSEKGIAERISVDTIKYIEISGRKTKIMQKDRVYETKISMSEWEKEFSELNFIRCHKSYLVNERYIRILSSSFAELEDGERIPISKHRLKEVKEKFFAYMNG